MLDLEAIDGRVGEAWSGNVPNGSHINVVLARRGSPTAAAVADGAGASRARGTRRSLSAWARATPCGRSRS